MTALTGFWRNATPEPPPANAALAPLRIARGISAFAIFAIFLALHRTDGASACWKKQVKIDDGPERLVPPQGGTNGSNPTCSSGESVSAVNPWAVCEKPRSFGGGLRVTGDVRRDVQGANRRSVAVFL